MSTVVSSVALEPTHLGPLALANHIVMAPMTRSRAPGAVPNALMAEYYRQRAGAGLIITEGTAPAADGVGYARIPGLYDAAQVAGWRCVTDAVHDAGGRIFVQLMHCGRVAHPLNLPNGAEIVAPSAVAARAKMWTDQAQLQDMPVPRALGTDEVRAVVRQHVRSAELALDAGFDGVELHGANGYLLEQFLNPAANRRTDRYGGSVEHRARFVVEAAGAVAEAIGAERTGVRLSPFSTFNDQPRYPETFETYAHLAAALQRLDLAYLHLVDPTRPDSKPEVAETVAAMRRLFTNPVILNGGYDALPRIEDALGSGRAQLIAVGRPYVANPDFVERLRDGLPLTAGDPATYYAPGPNGLADGYTTYPAAAAAGQPA